MENITSEEALRIIPDSEEEVLPSSPESAVSRPTRQTPAKVDDPCHQDLEDAATAAFKTTEEAMLNAKDCHESIDSPKELATNTQLNGTPTKPEQISATQCKNKTSSPQGHKLQSPKSLKSDPSTTIADLTAQRAALLGSFASIPSISSLLQAQDQPTASTLTDTDSGANASVISSSPPDTAVLGAAKNIIAQHIKLLHTYNEIKDIGQGLMGLIADARGVRIVEVQEEFGIGVKD